MKVSLSDITVKNKPSNQILFKIKKFNLSSGDKILIKGSSGLGKTTFLHLLGGLFTADEGAVVIDDTDLNKLSNDQRCIFRRKNIALIFQKLNLIEHLTNAENIKLGLDSNSKNTDLQIAQVLKKVGLEDRQKSLSNELSLGEQQRVAMARVLLSQAKLILADEPTSSLDEKNALQVVQLLFESAKNKSLIMVSHDLRVENFFHHIIDFKDLIQ